MSKGHFTNLVFGITFLNLVIVGLCNLSLTSSFFTMARFGALLCNLLMGIFLLFSRKSHTEATPLHRPYWLGMIVSNIFIFKMVDVSYPFFSVAAVIFVLGTLMVVVSLFSIGDSFAVTPMTSEIKTRFAYTFVRHPMYFGETLMVMACVLASSSPFSVVALLFFVYFTIRRILSEEDLLLRTSGYMDYCSHTRWRLLPFIW